MNDAQPKAPKAWRTTLQGIVSIVAAPDRNAARRITFASAKAAGYQPAWTAVAARRAPEYDAWARRLQPDRACSCYDEAIVRREIVDALENERSTPPGPDRVGP